MREEAYGKTRMTKMQVCEWHKRFHDWHKTAGFFFMTAPAHRSLVVKSSLPSTIALLYPSYFPDLSLPDIFLFP
jgi:hypothetical protein